MKIRICRDKAPRITATAFVDAAAVVIGDVTIGAHSSLWPMVVARGDVNSIVLGDCTDIGSPARKSRPLTEVEQRYLSDSAAHYVK